MASIAVLPILIGLAVDYAVQFQARAEEAAGSQRRSPTRRSSAAPTIATAALATAAGFLALLLSPVPMVRGFGELLIVGIAVALACALTAGSAALVLRRRRTAARAINLAVGARHRFGVVGRVRARGGGDRRPTPAPRARRARSRFVEPLGRSPAAARRPGRVLLVGLVLAVLGWVADTQTRGPVRHHQARAGEHAGAARTCARSSA